MRMFVIEVYISHHSLAAYKWRTFYLNYEFNFEQVMRQYDPIKKASIECL